MDSETQRRPADRLVISGLQVDAVIGVYAWERVMPQRLLLDVILPTDVNRAAMHDDLADTLDYGDLAARIREWVAPTAFQLIESMAAFLATHIGQYTGCAWVELTVHKTGAIPQANGVSIQIYRSFDPTPRSSDHP